MFGKKKLYFVDEDDPCTGRRILETPRKKDAVARVRWNEVGKLYVISKRKAMRLIKENHAYTDLEAPIVRLACKAPDGHVYKAEFSQYKMD